MTRRINGSLVALGFLVLGIMVYVGLAWLRPKPGQPSEWMSDVMISRAGVSEYRSFSDQSHIHGLKFFLFKARDPQRLIALLGLQRRNGVPDVLKGRIEHLKSVEGWNFNWERAVSYSTYYCNGEGANWTVDLLMVDGADVVYVTSGYASLGAVQVAEYEACAPQTR